MSIERFDISVPETTISDVRDRLMRTRWPEELSDSGWGHGTNRSFLEELTAYWRAGFDWRRQEMLLNRFAHFRADVGGIGVHFIHERGKGDDPMPIVLTHGYPDSFVRFLKIIPMLTDPAAHA